MAPRSTAARWWANPLVRALALGALVGLAFGVTGCGDDGSSKPKESRPKRKAGPKKKPKKTKGKGAGLQFYAKIEDFADNADEAKTIRHKFTRRDFESDSTGTLNRDPFQSFVIGQTDITTGVEGKSGNKQEKVCKNQVAKKYSLRDLRLIAIVLRGTRSYALFRDSASLGHTVTRGDCLGQEKARVSEIGSGFVKLEFLSEGQSDQGTGLRPTSRAIPLHPEELQLDDGATPSTE